MEGQPKLSRPRGGGAAEAVTPSKVHVQEVRRHMGYEREKGGGHTSCFSSKDKIVGVGGRATIGGLEGGVDGGAGSGSAISAIAKSDSRAVLKCFCSGNGTF